MPRKPARPKRSIHKRASAIRKKEVVRIHKKKPVAKAKTVTRVVYKNAGGGSVDKKLAENFIALQKVMVNLSTKFDNLASQIAKLLELFEISAKSLAKRDFQIEKGGKDETKMIQKLDTLAEQNKIIARGLTLMHEKMSGEEIPVQRPNIPTPHMRPPAPEGGVPPQPGPGAGMQGYQRSLSGSKPAGFKKLKSPSEE